MAGQNTRTVTLNLQAQTSGAEQVQALANELHRLAKSGGDAAPEFERLSQELTQIAQQQQAVDKFQELEAAVLQARAALDSATRAAASQASALGTLQARLAPLRAEEAQQAAAIRAATEARNQAKASYTTAQAAVGAYTAAIGGAKRANAEQKVELASLNQAVRDSKAEYLSAKAAVDALVPAYNRVRASIEPISEELRKQQRSLGEANNAASKAQADYTALSDSLAQVSAAMSKLGLDTKNITGEQNRLAQSMAALKTSADTLKTSVAAPGDAALTAAQKIDRAFAQTGVKSANAIRAEILKINSALMTLAKDATITGDDFDRAFASAKARIAELEGQLKTAEGAAKGFGNEFGSAFRQFAPATLIFNGVTGALNMLLSAGQRIPQVTAEFQTLERTLRIITGSSNAAAREFEYIKTIANRVGGDIKDLADGYIRLTAATKGTNLAGGQTRRIFEAISGSMGVLGASSAETSRAIQAVTQIVSKGVVSMEEFRQQLAERLPGAFQITAKELGITTSDLNELIASGKLAADDVLPALARGLEKTYQSGSQNDTLLAKWRQFTNALKDAAATVGNSGLLEGLLAIARVGTGAFQGLAETVILAGKSLGAFAAGVKTGDFKGAFAELALEAEAANKRIEKTLGISTGVKKSLSELADEAKKAGQAFVTMSDGTKMAVADVDKADDGFIRFMLASSRARDSAEGFATSARKAAEYVRSSGEASLAAANALGLEIDKRATAVRVAEENAAAIDKVVQAETRLLVEMEKEALKRAEAIRDNTAASDAHKQQLRDLGTEIEQRKVVVNGLNQQVEANRLVAESMRVKSEMDKDNSARVVELKAANEEFARVLGIVRAEVDAGNLSQQQLDVIEKEALKTKALYVDSLRDQQEKLTQLNAQRSQQNSVTAAGIRLEIEKLRTAAEVARAYGDEYTAADSLLRIKRLEIDLANLTAKAKRAEGESALAVVAAKRAELSATGQLTDAKDAELRAQELAAQVKLKEAEIAAETANRMRQLADATYYGANAADAAAGSYDRLSGSLDGVATSAERAASAQSNLRVAQIGTAPRDQAAQTINYDSALYAAGASVEETRAGSKYIGEIFSRMLAASPRSGEFPDRVLKAAAREAVILARKEIKTGEPVDLGPSVSELITRNTATTRVQNIDDVVANFRGAGVQAMQYRVNVAINGRSQKAVNVASPADADALVSMFRILEQQAGAAS